MVDVNELFTYGDGESVRLLLNGIAMMTSGTSFDGSTSNDYVALLKIFAIIGLFVAVAAGFVKARGEEAASYIIILAIFYGIILVPKQTVVVNDVIKNEVYTVDNVPLGIAAFASAESKIGYWLTETYETFFSLPDGLRYNDAGLMFASRVISERNKTTLTDPLIYRSMMNYMKDCAYPEFMRNPELFRKVMHTETNIWALLKQSENAGRYVYIYSSATKKFEIVNCAEAYGDLSNSFVVEVNGNIFASLAKKLNPKGSSAELGLMRSALIANLQNADSTILKISQDAFVGLKQAVMINLIKDSMVHVPNSVGDTESAQQALAATQAIAAANMSYITMAKVGESILPVARSAIHLVILGLFPVIMLMIVIAGVKAGSVLKYYLMMIFWVSLWAPLYALVNSIATYTASNNAIGAAGMYGANTFVANTAVQHSLISDQGIVGMLSLSVPVIAWMIVSFSASSISSIVSGLMSTSNSAAQKAGSDVSSGNISGGNVSWGNVSSGNYSWNTMSANKSDTVFSHKSDLGRGDIATAREDGTTSIAQDKNALRATAQTSFGQSSVLSQSASQLNTVAQSLTTQRAGVEEALLAKVRSHLKSLNKNTESSDGAISTSSSGTSGSAGTDVSHGAGVNHEAGFNTSNKGSVQGVVGGAIKGGRSSADANNNETDGSNASSKSLGKRSSPIDPRAGVEASSNYSAETSKNMSVNNGYREGTSASEQKDFIDRLSKDASFRRQVMGGESDSEDTKAQIAKRDSLTKAIQDVQTIADSLQQQAMVSQTQGTSTSMDVLSRPGSPEYAQDLANLIHSAEAHPEGRGAEALQGVASALAGQSQGTDLAGNYLNGSRVKGTADLAQAASENAEKTAASGAPIDQVHQGNLAEVPNSGKQLGQDSPEARRNAGLVSKADEQHGATKAEVAKSENQLETGQRKEEARYNLESGDTNSQTMNPNTQVSVTTVAAQNAGADIAKSAETAAGQVITNIAGDRLGSKINETIDGVLGTNLSGPSLTERQEAAGYNPETGKFSDKNQSKK